jgi:hypothetical protein
LSSLLSLMPPTCSGAPSASMTCSPVMCMMYCEFGFKVDSRGCSVCACFNPCEDYECSPGQVCVPLVSTRSQCPCASVITRTCRDISTTTTTTTPTMTTTTSSPTPDGPCMFYCDNGMRCVTQSMRCNGIVECNDYIDEFECPGNCEVHDMFECADTHRCIPKYYQCDGNRNCDDGSDEANCGGASTTWPPTTPFERR